MTHTCVVRYAEDTTILSNNINLEHKQYDERTQGKQETKAHKNTRDLCGLICRLCTYSTGGRDESIYYYHKDYKFTSPNFLSTVSLCLSRFPLTKTSSTNPKTAEKELKLCFLSCPAVRTASPAGRFVCYGPSGPRLRPDGNCCEPIIEATLNGV